MPPPSATPEVPIVMPALGWPSARVSVWFAEPGDAIYEGDRLVEVSVGGATFDVAAPATGRLASQLAQLRDELSPGAVLGFVAAEQ
jgi:pyruvate/2-oxoglutarate dehydrogenase complex dihydrolipoamide acyltransferase (E2) component